MIGWMLQGNFISPILEIFFSYRDNTVAGDYMEKFKQRQTLSVILPPRKSSNTKYILVYFLSISLFIRVCVF